jgi:hypothetical protein
MSIFDLIFLLSALISMVSVLAAATLAFIGRRRSARAIVRSLGIYVLGYLALSILVSAMKPQRILAVGTPWCFDDWCLAVDRVTEQPSAQSVSYAFDLRVLSRARRVSQRASGAWIYVLDEQGHQYAPTTASDETPLDVLLLPEEVRYTTRTFVMPAGIPPVGLITGHGAGYCGVMSVLIIGAGGCVFRKPPMIGLSNRSSRARAEMTRSAD